MRDEKYQLQYSCDKGDNWDKHVTSVTNGRRIAAFLFIVYILSKKSALFPYFTLIDKVFNQLSFERIEYRKQIQRISETDHHVIL